MTTLQNADAGYRNVVVNNNLVCQGVLTAANIRATEGLVQNLTVDNLDVIKRGNLSVAGNLTVAGSTILNTLNVSGATTLQGVTNAGNEVVDGSLTVQGPTTLANTTITNSTITGNEIIQNNSTVQGVSTAASLNVTGNATVGGNLTVAGTCFFGPSFTASQVVYVNMAGNDTTGTGTLLAPYLTIQRAMTAITDASQSKMYSVVLGPGIYTANFSFKPWVNLSGAPGGSAFQGLSQIGASTIMSFDASWTGTTFDVAWFTHLTFNNTPSFTFTNLNAQLTFFASTFNMGATYIGGFSGNVNNITWDCCLGYGPVLVQDCSFLFLIGGTSTFGTGQLAPNPSTSITLKSTSAAGPASSTKLLALGGNLAGAASPFLSLVTGAGSGGTSVDLEGCGLVGVLSLNSTGGLPISFTATAEGSPSSITFLGTATIANVTYRPTGYIPGVLANWSGTQPVSVQNALDRIAAKITPIP